MKKYLGVIESDRVESELIYMLFSRKAFLVGGHLNRKEKQVKELNYKDI